MLIVVASIFWKSKPDKENNNGEICIQVVTSARNPATGEIKEFPTPCDVPEGWETLEGSGNEQYEDQGVTWQKYRNSDLGISFEYKKEPNGYTLLEEEADLKVKPGIVNIITLMNTKEYTEMMSSNIPRESPPGISIMILDNPENLSAKSWAEDRKQISLFDSKLTTLVEKNIGGAPAVIYKADGLYQNDMIVVNNNFKIYVISGGYNAPTDTIRKDFEKLVESILIF